jgi:hypothetical protein
MSKQQKHEKDAEYWRREVDDIINTLEKPGMRQVGTVLQLNCTKAELPFAFEIGGELHYRGRILDPVAKPKQPKLRDVQLSIEGRR